MLVPSLFVGLATLVLPSVALPHAVTSHSSYKFPDHCKPNPCEGITFQNSTYVCGDPRLGPVAAPKMFPLNNELQSYERFGNLCPATFLQKWAGSTNANATYKYPPANGFVATTSGTPIIGNVTLPVGQKLDRFGSEYGSFLAPLGAPYIERALPPSNLDTYDGSHPFNYYVYEVTKSFDVGAGPIAPWFEQPGGGTQYVTYTNVKGLLEGGYLRRLTPEEYDEPREFSDDYTPGPAQ
ncbi:hypothetical protein POX_e06885 [Penicillium oxalicum]|uniref:TNT domain-containing protein n=1 Tax=Penicillium oxalicum (strain 114-2 / CGMCC 5302) TaxID=933388 RepID=S7ZBF9_PENO1|nr:hypothetical protein POX_e06885 [Penicillium oxalicum]EPS27910.1 hypothetical protein PDE_02854 [Penicillium oxalicum 114-2]KAI2788861.1 hypothetical protein POX_e06885 [Penicillium oxalicum]